MVTTQAPRVELSWQAVDFSLPGIDGKTHDLKELAGENGTVIAFMSNHCPYARAITGRLVEAVEEMREFGVELTAVNPNDAEAYPEDSFENMKRFAAERGFNFPYLHD